MDLRKNIVFKKNKFIPKSALLSFCALCQAVHMQDIQAEENSDNPHGEFYLQDHPDKSPDQDYYMKDHAVDDELAMEGDVDERTEFLIEDKREEGSLEDTNAKKFFSLNIPFFRKDEVTKKNDKDDDDKDRKEEASFFGFKIPFFATEGRIEKDLQTEEEGLKTDFENRRDSIEEISVLEETSLTKEQNVVNKTFRVVLEPFFKTQISAEIKTTVLSVNKKMGESFKKGEVLINLDSDLYLAELNRAQAFFDKNQAEYEALKQLFQKNIASKVEVESAKAARVSALSDLVMANRSFERCFIKAPYDGNVVEVFVEDYEHVDVGSPLVLIQDDTKLIAKLVLPASILELIKEGKELPLFKEQPQDVIGYATVKRIGAQIDPSSGLVKVDAEVDNSNKKLLPGMVVNVEISGYTSSN